MSKELVAENTRLHVRIEELEHELGRLREVLRRIIGYVDGVRSVAGLEETHGSG